jgi:transcription elongation factor GreA
MNGEMYLTQEGASRLRKELEQLKGPARQDMARRLRSAIQMGDLSENADYHKAKEDQAFLEGRIQELEYLLKNATIVENDGMKMHVADIGARVTIQEDDYPAETFQLVGVKEADPSKGRISHESPIGQALMGKRAGDVVEAETPNGSIRLKILEVE